MNKQQILQQKSNVKMSLRNHHHIKKKNFIQYDEQQQEKRIESKSRKWWERVNKRYFMQGSKQEMLCVRNNIVEQFYLPKQNSTVKQQSYFNRNLLQKNQRIFQKKNIKVLFQNNQTTFGQSQSFVVGFSFVLKNQQEQDTSVERPIQLENSEQKINLETEISKINQNKENAQDNELGNIKIEYFKIDSQIQQQLKQSPLQHSSSSYQYQGPESPQQNLLTRHYSKKHIIPQPQIPSFQNHLQLHLTKSSHDLQFVTQCTFYDMFKKTYFKSQLDKQIYLWQQQLKKVQALNQMGWQNIFQNFQKEIQQRENIPMVKKVLNGYDMEEDTKNIHKYLAWQHNLINIRHGFADKNQEMLAEAIEGLWSKQHMNDDDLGEKKRFLQQSFENLILTKSQLLNSFETDCKICFSNYVSDKNKVIYCDRCNQSFHQKCYGIEDLDEDPESKYYCDPCTEIMSQTNRAKPTVNGDSQLTNKSPKIPKITCQICHVQFSPLKKVQTHFFHPSCLFLNNMLKSQTVGIQLKQQWTCQKIISYVKSKQKQNKYPQCQYCAQSCNKGLKFKCAEEQCQKYFHTLCAYLNAAVFDMERIKENLRVQIRCWEHFSGRDHIRQIYLRRFFCNYNNASNINQNQLLEIYNQELEYIREYKQELHQKNPSNKLTMIAPRKQKRQKQQKRQKKSSTNYNYSHNHAHNHIHSHSNHHKQQKQKQSADQKYDSRISLSQYYSTKSAQIVEISDQKYEEDEVQNMKAKINVDKQPITKQKSAKNEASQSSTKRSSQKKQKKKYVADQFKQNFQKIKCERSSKSSQIQYYEHKNLQKLHQLSQIFQKFISQEGQSENQEDQSIKQLFGDGADEATDSNDCSNRGTKIILE